MQPSSETPFVRIADTPARPQAPEREGQGPQARPLELEELEERITPGRYVNSNESLLVEPLEERVAPRIALNHNESMLDA